MNCWGKIILIVTLCALPLSPVLGAESQKEKPSKAQYQTAILFYRPTMKSSTRRKRRQAPHYPFPVGGHLQQHRRSIQTEVSVYNGNQRV
jgi:hypothetical protein